MDAKAKKRPALGWVAVALALGMLIWVRLRLVTDIPRSAYADPEKQSEPARAGGAVAERPTTEGQGRVASGGDEVR